MASVGTLARTTVTLLVVCAAAVAMASEIADDPAEALRARYESSRERLVASPFGQPIEVESWDDAKGAGGDVYAVVDHPLSSVREAFTHPTDWCEALILHLNVKYCHPLARDDRVLLSLAIGRKHEEPLRSTARMELLFDVATSRPDHFAVALAARKGPYGTRRYRIALEAVAVDDGHSFVHMRYAYEHDALGRLAMSLYLATSGRGKVGFTQVGVTGEGGTKLVGGNRGAVERNAMRYFLAIDAYLATRGLSLDARLDRWFAATERYARQLHEVDRDAYLAMKRDEWARQQEIRSPD